MIHGVEPPIGNFIRLALQAQTVDRFGTGETTDEHSAIVFASFPIRDIVEQKAAARFFG